MNLESFLQQARVDYEKHNHRAAYTAQRLADAEHTSGYQVAKPVVVRSRAGFAMCVLPAPKRLDIDRAAAALRQPDLRLATESEMAGVFPDCELGAEPPIGRLFGLETVVDDQLLRGEYITMQAGTHTEAIRTRREVFEQLCRPIVAPIAAG